MATRGSPTRPRPRPERCGDRCGVCVRRRAAGRRGAQAVPLSAIRDRRAGQRPARDRRTGADAAGGDGVANLTARGLLEGTMRRDGNTLTEQFERLGAGVFAGADWDTANAGVTVL